MLTNPKAPRVRAVASLARRSARIKRGAFLAEGPQAVREAVHHRPDLVQEVYADESAATGDGPVGELAAQARAAGLPVRLVSARVMTAMCDTQTPQGILAVCAIPPTGPQQVFGAQQPRLVAILAQARDPGNAGSVIRSADAAGADGVLLTEGSVDPFNPKCVRATAGSVFHLPISTGVPMREVVELVRGHGLRVLAADGTAALSLEEVDLMRPHAWVFGNEAWGLAPEVREHCDAAVRVPIYGQAESLNLAMAATVCLYASAGAQRRAVAEGAR